MGKFRDHKIQTQQSFIKVKRRHTDYDRRFDDVEVRVKELENTLAQLNDMPQININRKKRH